MSLYEQVMGHDFLRLAPVLRRFHRLAGHHSLSGVASIQGPCSLAARLLALCLGTPRHSTSGPLRFELDAQPDAERWTRHFPGRTMTSHMRLQDGRVVEQLGAARLTFGLNESGDLLEFRVSAALPWVGMVTHYEGHLRVPEEAAP